MIALLVNPAAGGGRALARAALVERALAPLGDVHVFRTREKGDERTRARDAYSAGAQVLAVVGGDGSIHHAALGLLDESAPIPLAIFAAGTGNDFAKTLGTPAHDIAAMCERVARGTTLAVDVGVIDGVPFLNAAGVGFDVAVLERMQQPATGPRVLRGTAAYVSTALGALFAYEGFSAHLDTATHASAPTPAKRLMTVFANGRAFGGAFHIAPTASLTDGQLDVVDIHDVPAFKRIGLFVHATRGTHVHRAGVETSRTSQCTLMSDRPMAFQADGELYRAASTRIDVSVVPSALRLII